MTDVRTTLESTPIAGDMVSAPGTAHAPDGFRRVAAVAGIAAVAVGMVTIPLMGSAPVLGDSAEDIGAYFAGNADLHRPAVVIAALLAIPIVLFFAGVHRALVVSSGRSASAWATVFLYGAIMMSATAGLKEALYAVAVRYAATDPDLGVLAVLSDSSAIAGATLGAWLAVTVGAVWSPGSRWSRSSRPSAPRPAEPSPAQPSVPSSFGCSPAPSRCSAARCWPDRHRGPVAVIGSTGGGAIPCRARTNPRHTTANRATGR
jgi:hypothetical protein